MKNKAAFPKSSPSELLSRCKAQRLLVTACMMLVLSLGSLSATDDAPPLPVGAEGSWWSGVQQKIAAAEYELSWQTRTVLPDLEEAWHAPNRAQNLRTYFAPEGIRVVSRSETEPTWEWSLSLLGYGRDKTVVPVSRARLSPFENRIDYERGPIVEWYVNDERGLEQGFTLEVSPEDFRSGVSPAGAPPIGARHSRQQDPSADVQPAFVVMVLGGTLSPVISTDGQAIDFVTPQGAKVLRYAKLIVTDARGTELAAWMEGFAEAGVRGIRIVFDDGDALYPVTIDPLATSPAWTAESNQIDANLAYALSTAGDVNGDGFSDVIVGAYAYDNGEVDEGRAFVYHGSASGLSAVEDWSAESNQAGARFGLAVSIAGDVNADGYADVIVGADLYDNVESDEGRAFVYHGSATGLSAFEDWSAEIDQSNAQFGVDVSMAGDVNGDGYADVIVGAVFYDNGETDEGGAFVYHGSASGLSAVADWSAESNQVNAQFGFAASTAGDVNADGFADVIVGARTHDNGETNEGRAYVYHGSASGLGAVEDWSAESNQTNAGFGYAVSTAGDVNGDGYTDVIVGAYSFDNGETNEGRAYVYHGSASGLSTVENWTAESNQAGAELGRSASTAGDVNGDGYADVIVGAYRFDNGQTDEGRAFVYHGSASGLSAVENWTAESDQAGARFGFASSTAGDVNGDGYADVIVGAHAYDNGETNEGRAFVYHGSAAGLSAAESWTAEADQADAEFGFSVSTGGDVDGDGYADVIVGARYYDNGQADEGRAFVYHGSASGLSAIEAWTAESDQLGANFGSAVSTAGDVNGDGYADVIVGARFYDNGESNEGRAFVYHGSASGLSAVEGWATESDQADAFFGHSVSTAGDVNGDGYADVIVGAYSFDNGETNEGRAYVYHGSASGLSAVEGWTAESDQAGAQFGYSVSGAGDVNGDGYADVIVGARFYDNGETNEGRAFVYHGSASGLGTVEDWTAESDQTDAQFGYSASTAGDVNGDGYADVIIGAIFYGNGETNEGRAYVYHGSNSSLSTVAAWTAESNQAGARFGYSVSGAGDVNGDGYADVIVGAFRFDNGQTDEGRAYVYHGSNSGLSTAAAWTAESDQTFAQLGYSVSTAGDVNGDGYADVIVGAILYANGETDEGRAFVYYGNDGAGLSLTPQQRRADDLAPIAAGGRSRESGSFRLAATGRTPFGRGKVKLEWEVKPFGTSFDGVGTGTSAWLDTATAGATFNEVVSNLEPGDQHWRMRLLYDPATTPLQPASRWFTIPWNGRQERDLTISAFIGGQVWEDRNTDGIMDASEPRLAGVRVRLLDTSGTVVDTKITIGDGSYRFDVDPGSDPVRIRFEAPAEWGFTDQDQGLDDFVDSDADPTTGETAQIVSPFDASNEQRWSAGLRRVGICFPPDEVLYIYSITTTTDGNDYPILNFQDPNQPADVTGYNIYRASDAGLPRDQWPLVADDVVDMDEAEPNKQWTDTSGDTSPTGSWFYQVAAYNNVCPSDTAEGPW